MQSKDEKFHIVRAEKAFEFKDTISPPWNPESSVPGTQLERLVGLQRCRVTVLRVPAGGQASVFHTHLCEEEWMYVLQGQGILDIEGNEHLLGPGDFAGFPAASAAHQLKNPFGKILVCLRGGERVDVDIADFPREGKRMYRHGDEMEVYDMADAEETGPANIDEIVSSNMRRALKNT